MHILGILGSIITILYLLDRLGIDIGWFNPWSWRRRRAWANKYEGDPIYSVEDPIQIAAILIAGVAKLNGDLSAEQKRTALELFEEKFSLSSNAANDLLASATHLMGAPQVIGTQLSGLAAKNRDNFSEDQAGSMLEMIGIMANAEGQIGASQIEYLEEMRELFSPRRQDGTWT